MSFVPSDGSQGSITAWIHQLKAGEADAAQQLWIRYADRLTELARRKLGSAPRRIADEEDVAQSVFHLLCRGAQAGRFQNLHDRDELWWWLLMTTKQKSVDNVRRELAQKRGGGRVQALASRSARGDSSDELALDDVIGAAPTPEFLVMLQEQNDRLLGLLRDDCLRSVAMWRMEGFTVAEIAAKLAIGVRAVERKLRLIRDKWRRELQP
jgi:DNA-directed RNA polymerase specialized sigma24 family protein